MLWYADLSRCHTFASHLGMVMMARSHNVSVISPRGSSQTIG